MSLHLTIQYRKAPQCPTSAGSSKVTTLPLCAPSTHQTETHRRSSSCEGSTKVHRKWLNRKSVWNTSLRHSHNPKTSQASIIPMSFETIVDDNNRDFLCYCIKNNQGFIGRRRMPNNIADIDTDFSAGTLIRNAACHYVMNNINPHDRLIQWTSCARNTLAWWPISVFREMGMFNPACGLIQGMEDWELILRAVIDSETTFAIPDMEFWYDDIRLTSLAERPSDDKDIIGQKTKLAGEIPTLRAIWQLLAVEFMNRNKGVATGEERMHRSPHEAEFELMSSYIEPKT